MHDFQNNAHHIFFWSRSTKIQLDELLYTVFVDVEVRSGGHVYVSVNVLRTGSLQNLELVILEIFHVSVDCSNIVFKSALILVRIVSSLLFQCLNGFKEHCNVVAALVIPLDCRPCLAIPNNLRLSGTVPVEREFVVSQ